MVTAVVLPVSPRTESKSDTSTYTVDPVKSRLTIHVGKAGAFSFAAGHTHEVSGPIRTGSVDVDSETPSQSRVRLVIVSAELAVSAAGEPAGDTPKVQETMQGEKVLDAQRHREITYESTSVTVKSRRDNEMDLNVVGRFTIRDVTLPVTVPVHVELAGNQLSASGHFEIKQSAFGIKPISIGGVVAVKDTLAIEFSIVATR